MSVLNIILAALWCGGRDFRRCCACKRITPWHKGACLVCGRKP